MDVKKIEKDMWENIKERAAKGRNINFDEIKILDRINQPTGRKTGQIGFAVTRGGEIAGEHTVNFIGENDRINIVHTANNRSIFVKGAIEAAIFLSSKKIGLYSMNEVIEYNKKNMTITMQFFNILLEKYQLMTNNTNHIRINDGYYMLSNT